MKVIIFGSSHGIPEGDRQCTSYMVDVDGHYYFIDMGMQVISGMRRRGMDVTAVEMIACTHPHGDHTDGLLHFVDEVNWAFRIPKLDVILPHQEMVDAVHTWLHAIGVAEKEQIRYHVAHPGIIYEDERVRLTAFRTQHCIPSYAFLFEAEGKKILFTGDLHAELIDFPIDACTSPELIVTESAHFDAENLTPFLADMKPQKVVFSHIAPGRTAALYKFLGEDHPYPCIAAIDDLEINM